MAMPGFVAPTGADRVASGAPVETPGFVAPTVFTGESTYTGLQPSTADAINTFYKANPAAFKNPALVDSVARTYGISPSDAGQSLKYLALYNNATKHIYSEATGSAPGQGWWGSVLHSLHDAWSGIANTFTNSMAPTDPGGGFTANLFGGLQRGVSQDAGLAKGVYQGTLDVGQMLKNATQRVATTGEELATPSMAHYRDALNTVTNIVATPLRLADPWSQQNGYQLMRHTLAYVESMAARHGWSYALGDLMPTIAAMYATDGAVSAPMEAGSAAEQAMNTVNMLTAARDAGTTLTPEQEAALADAQRAVVRGKVERLKADARKSMLKAANPVRERMAWFAEKASTPATMLYRVARLAGRPFNDIRLNAGYLVNQELAQAGPNSDLWDKTRGGQVINADGKPEDLFTQTALYFNYHPNDMFYSTSSGIFNIYTKYLGSDPVGAVGKVIGQARSLEGLTGWLRDIGRDPIKTVVDRNGMLAHSAGFTGQLGMWFRGLGIHTADDVYATMYKPQVARAYSYMATHTGAEIARDFRGTYSPQMLRKLGDATSFNQVVDLHAAMADARGYIAQKAPTVGVYTGLKRWVAHLFEDSGGTVQQVLSSPYSELAKEAPGVRRATGMEIKMYDAPYIVTDDAGLRWRTVVRRWAAAQLTKRPMYYSTATRALENKIIVPGDYNSIPAIMDMAKAAMLPTDEVKAIGDFLLRSENPDEWTNAYRNILHHMIMRRAGSAIPATEWDSVAKRVDDWVASEVARMAGVDGAGREGLYVAGPNGKAYSEVIFKNSQMRNAASGPSQFGHLRIPEARDLNALARTIRNTAMAVMPRVHSVGDMTMETAKVSELAAARGLTAESIRTGVMPIADLRASASAKDMFLSSAGKTGYAQAVERNNSFIRFRAGEFRKAGYNEAETYAGIYDRLRTRYTNSLAMLNEDALAREERAFGIVHDGSPIDESATLIGEKERDTAKGGFYALHDLMTSMNRQLIGDEAISVADMKAWAMQRAKGLSADAADTAKAYNRFYHEIFVIREARPNFANNFQTVVDFLNRQISRIFVPLALLSGRWAIHVSVSEAMLNSLRVGGFNFFDAKVAEAIARHELKGVGLYRGEAFLIRDAVAGALLGVERGMLKGMPEDARNRMLSDFTSAIMRHDGHLPMSVHQQDSIFETDSFNQMVPQTNYIDTGRIGKDGRPRLKQTRYGRTQNFVASNPGEQTYAPALAEHIKQVHYDEVKLPLAKVLDKMLYDAELGTTKLAGAKGSDAWLANIKSRLMPEAERIIRNLPPEVASRMERLNGVLKDGNLSSTGLRPVGRLKYTRQNSVTDAAAAAVEDVVHTVTGRGSRWIVHRNLLDLVLSGDTPGDGEMATMVRQMVEPDGGSTAPENIPARGFKDLSFTKDWANKDLIIHVSDVGHDKILGPIVNRMIRTPLWLLEYHRQMEFLRPMIGGGERSLAEARDLYMARYNNDAQGNVIPLHIQEKRWIEDMKSGEKQAADGLSAQGAQMARDAGLTVIPSDYMTGEYVAAHTAFDAHELDAASRQIDLAVRDAEVNGWTEGDVARVQQAMDTYYRLIEYKPRPTLTEEEAQVMAEDRATQNMAKFVHNPKDKAVFEQNARVLAPFYFAKNQAWRRAFRLLGDDPGAFEKYMKMCLGVTNYIAVATAGGSAPSVVIPGSQILGAMDGINPLALNSVVPAGASATGFGFAGSAGSVTSMVPTGDLAGWKNMLGGFASPPWGPLVDIPLKEGLSLYSSAFGPHPLVTKWVHDFLGAQSANTSIVRDIIPSGILDDTLALIEGLYNKPNSTAMSIQNEVLNNMFDNFHSTIYAKVRAQFDPNNTNLSPARRSLLSSWSAAQRSMAITGEVDVEMSKQLQDPTIRQEFLDRAHANTGWMMFVKTIFNFFSPLSLSVNETFSKSPEFDALLKKEGSYNLAAQKFAEKYPNHILDLTAHTTSLRGNFPETTDYLDLLTNHPGLVNKYQYASAYLASRTGKFSPLVYQLDISMHLRARETPTDYYNSILYALGNDYYYNSIVPELLASTRAHNPDGTPATNPDGSPTMSFAYPNYVTEVPVQQVDGSTVMTPQLNYAGYKAAQQAAKYYGYTTNYVWYQQFTGARQKYVANQAFTEMKQLLADPAQGYLKGADLKTFRDLVTGYENTAKTIAAYRAAGDTQAASLLSNQWFAFCQEAAVSPRYAKQSFFISSVLQKMPNP